MLQCSTLKIQQLAYRSWHQVNRQEELLTGRGRRSGRWNSWRIVSNWNQRARCNCTHAWRWWHRSWFLAGFNSIHPLEKTIHWCLDSSSFSLAINDMVAWIDFWTAAENFVYHSTFRFRASKTVPPQIKKIPLPFPESSISWVLQLLPFLWTPIHY